jgi:hypothetical protein
MDMDKPNYSLKGRQNVMFLNDSNQSADLVHQLNFELYDLRSVI